MVIHVLVRRILILLTRAGVAHQFDNIGVWQIMANYRVVIVKTGAIVWTGQAEDAETVIDPDFLKRRGVTLHAGVKYDLQLWRETFWARLTSLPVRR